MVLDPSLVFNDRKWRPGDQIFHSTIGGWGGPMTVHQLLSQAPGAMTDTLNMKNVGLRVGEDTAVSM